MDLPIENGGSFRSYVSLPEGKCWENHWKTWKSNESWCVFLLLATMGIIEEASTLSGPRPELYAIWDFKKWGLKTEPKKIHLTSAKMN